MEPRGNSLTLSTSPYLRQHASNPVWWQEWSEVTLAHARQTQKPILASVGYSTCHWCHVMAADAFSDDGCARYLNENFVSIKIDREQRPDIDHYLMTFLVATTGSGGWPLNAFLTPDGDPFFAMTYAATVPRFNTPGFLEILKKVHEFYTEHAEEISAFELPTDESRASGSVSVAATEAREAVSQHDIGTEEAATQEPYLVPIRDEDETEVAEIVEGYRKTFNANHGGFGAGAQFPPHCPLLFLLHAASAGFGKAEPMIRRTLDAMRDGGLHDHLQGGFFRYTVDSQWVIPHFEKMLYDQAMLLWNYSVAERLFPEQGYGAVAERIIACLDQTFDLGEFYASGHDADTGHQEGATYLWAIEEVQHLLTPDEMEAIEGAYLVTAGGNFEGKNHLTRRSPRSTQSEAPALAAAERKLLEARKKRAQPDRDEKVIVGWNALAGIALFAAHRFAGIESAGSRAERLTHALINRFCKDAAVFHGEFENRLDTNRFLSDHAALMLLVSYAQEHSDSDDLRATKTRLAEGISSFLSDGIWIENLTDDFAPHPADPYDQPLPSAVAMAEFALLRHAMTEHTEYAPVAFAGGQGRAFFDIAALASRGFYWTVTAAKQYSWSTLPPNSVFSLGEPRMSCYRGVCYLGPPPESFGKKDKG